jgi:hypothetical protein
MGITLAFLLAFSDYLHMNGCRLLHRTKLLYHSTGVTTFRRSLVTGVEVIKGHDSFVKGREHRMPDFWVNRASV